MSRSDFRKLCDRNIAKWEASIETPGDDVETGPLRPENEGRDEDVVPPQSQQRNSRQQAPPLEVALAEREAVDSSQLNSLFIDSPGTTKANAELFVRQPPKARKPPIVQSDSSSASEGEVTDDSMMVEITTASEKTRRKSTGEGDSDSELQSTRKLARPSSTTLKRAATTPNPKTAAKPSPAKPARTTETRKSSPPQANSGSRAGQVKTILTQQSASTAGGPTSGASGTVTAKRSVSFATQPSSSKTISDTGKNSGIKIVNQPKIQPRQTFAQEATRHYKTLHGRAVAQKNSGREGTPDISALSFVNAPPGATVSIPRAPRDDPYGRREPSRRRSTETYTDDGSPGRQSRDANTRLEDWELDKVPLVCYSWRLSNSCPKSAKECRFMHRDKDEHGRDYRLGDMQGYIPAKYRKPPLTCPWWLNHRQGCKKSAEECEFAHKNTGWMKHLDHKVREVRIDPDKRPKSSIPEGHSEVQSTRRSLPPNQLTCWYWKHRKCRYSDQRCAFLHKDTDNVADEPPSTQQGPVSMTDETGDMGSVDMDIDDAVQPDVADEVTRSPSPIPVEQSQQHPLQPPPPPPPMELPPVEFTCEQLRTRINSVCKLDFEDMLSNDSEAVSNPVERRAFVMFHPRDHFVELDIITRWLLMHHVQVSSASYVGGWADFQQQVQKRGSGIIIVRNIHAVK
jgi:chromo domain-containing protein 1